MANLTIKYPKRVIKSIKKRIVNKQFTTTVSNFKDVRSNLFRGGIVGQHMT